MRSIGRLHCCARGDDYGPAQDDITGLPLSPSCPALCRASTSSFICWASEEDVDGRDISAFTRVFDALCPAMTPLWGNAERHTHSGLTSAALTIGHHFSISAFWNAPSASGVCWSRGGNSRPRSSSRLAMRGRQCLRDGPVELCDHILRRVLRHPQAIPERQWNAAVRPHPRSECPARRRRLNRDRLGPDVARAHLRQEIRGLFDHQVDLAGDRSLHRRPVPR